MSNTAQHTFFFALKTFVLLLFVCIVSCDKYKDEIAQPEIAGDIYDTTFTLTDPPPAPLIGNARSLAYRLIIGNHLLKWSDGATAKIVEVNSPETALAYLDYNWLNWAHANGANTIYMSVNGKESGKPQISPYKNNQISQGFDDAKVNAWVAFAAYWCSLDERKILHLLLSEKETHFLYTDAQRKAAMDYLVVKFAPVAGHIIWDREEWADGQTAQANNLYSYLRGIDPVNIRAMHNNTNGKPWSGFYGTDLIQFLSFQAWSGSFDNQIRTEVNKFPATVTGYASETTEGFAPTDIAKAETLFNAAPGFNSGAGVYVKCCDQRDTRDNWHLPYYPVFNRLAQLAGTPTPGDTTTPPPPPAAFTVSYSASNTRTPATRLAEGATIGLANKYFFVPTNEGVAPVKFTLKKNGATVVPQRTENSAPFDMIGGSSTTATAYNFTGGSYQIIVSNGNGATATINFTIQ